MSGNNVEKKFIIHSWKNIITVCPIELFSIDHLEVGVICRYISAKIISSQNDCNILNIVGFKLFIYCKERLLTNFVKQDDTRETILGYRMYRKYSEFVSDMKFDEQLNLISVKGQDRYTWPHKFEKTQNESEDSSSPKNQTVDDNGISYGGFYRF